MSVAMRRMSMAKPTDDKGAGERRPSVVVPLLQPGVDGAIGPTSD